MDTLEKEVEARSRENLLAAIRQQLQELADFVALLTDCHHAQRLELGGAEYSIEDVG